jgi:hypothetical protein
VGDGSAKAWLYAVGGAAEFAGVLLVGAPELESYAGHVWSALLPFLRRLGYRQEVRMTVGAAGGVAMGGSARVKTSLSDNATLEERVAWLASRVDSLDDSVHHLAGEATNVRGEFRRALDERAEQVTAATDAKLTALRGEHFAFRVSGVVLLLFGVFLSTWGNLL